MIEYLFTQKSKYVSGEGAGYLDTLRKHKLNPKTFPAKELLCMFIQDPNPAETTAICKDFGLEEKWFKKFRSDKRSVRYSFNPLVFSMTDYYTDSANKIHMARLLFVVKHNVLLMIMGDKNPYFRNLFLRVTENVKARKLKSEAYLLYEFLHEDAKENYDVIELMDDKIAKIEQQIIENKQTDILMLREIMTIKKELILMNKRLWASSKVVFTIRKDLTSLKLSHEELALLDDIYDTLIHQIDLIETQKETVTDFLEIFTTTISNRLAATSNELNMVMKKMAALTIIIMVPTLIAGVYGTNFHILPEITWKYGYLYMWIAMILAAGITYWSFHKKRWV